MFLFSFASKAFPLDHIMLTGLLFSCVPVNNACLFGGTVKTHAVLFFVKGSWSGFFFSKMRGRGLVYNLSVFLMWLAGFHAFHRE